MLGWLFFFLLLYDGGIAGFFLYCLVPLLAISVSLRASGRGEKQFLLLLKCLSRAIVVTISRFLFPSFLHSFFHSSFNLCSCAFKNPMLHAFFFLFSFLCIILFFLVYVQYSQSEVSKVAALYAFLIPFPISFSCPLIRLFLLRLRLPVRVFPLSFFLSVFVIHPCMSYIHFLR